MVSIIRSAQIDSAHHTLNLPVSDALLETTETLETMGNTRLAQTRIDAGEAVPPMPRDYAKNDADNRPQPSEKLRDDEVLEELRLLKEKLKETEGLLEEARHQLEARINEHKDKAYEDGLEAGKEEGRRTGRAEFEQQASRLTSIADELSLLKEHVVESAEDSLVEIVMEAVCKTLGDSLRDARAVREILAHSLKRLSGARVARIRLGPADFELVSKLAAHELSESLESVEFLEDEAIGSGGCVLESDVGTLDCRLETQLGRFKEVLLTVRRSHE